MKQYQCDYCETITEEATVSVKGVLSPYSVFTYHFCSVDCYWNWVKHELHDNNMSGALERERKQWGTKYHHETSDPKTSKKL